VGDEALEELCRKMSQSYEKLKVRKIPHPWMWNFPNECHGIRKLDVLSLRVSFSKENAFSIGRVN